MYQFIVGSPITAAYHCGCSNSKLLVALPLQFHVDHTSNECIAYCIDNGPLICCRVKFVMMLVDSNVDILVCRINRIVDPVPPEFKCSRMEPIVIGTPAIVNDGYRYTPVFPVG